jgi:predicted ATPase
VDHDDGAVGPALRKVQLENILSFRSAELSLGKLNVLVGPNGAGKSNLLRAIEFIGQVARYDLVPAIERSGGFERLHYQGRSGGPMIRLRFEVMVTKFSSEKAHDVYELSFSRRVRTKNHAVFRREEILAFKRTAGRGRRITVKGDNFFVIEDGKRHPPAPQRVQIGSTSAGLATIRKLGQAYGAEQANDIASLFENFRVFEVDVRRVVSPSLRPQPTNVLAPSASNLASYLKTLSDTRPDIFDAITEDLAYVSTSTRSLSVRNLGAGTDEGFVVELNERGISQPTPLSRASFGTVRALALFAMLHDPHPPRLTCIEEIDHGLHPYALDRVVDRMRTASTRTQIIAVTHSPALVNRLQPSELIVFERDGETGETILPLVDASAISEAEQDSGLGLGEMWFSGAIGGIPT